MASITVEGKHPLVGEVRVSGAKNVATKVICASLFSSEDIVLENVPRVTSVINDLELIKSIGGTAIWTGTNTVTVNGSNINTYDVPYELGSRTKTSVLLTGPLLFRFGKARIPKFAPETFKPGPLNRFIDTWERLGVRVEENDIFYELDASAIKSSNILFSLPTHMGTDSAILSSLFVPGETIIDNASEEIEVDSLMDFCNLIGGSVTRVDPKRLSIKGTNIFKGGKYKLSPDKAEIAVFASLAILTNGNIIVKGADRVAMIPFVNFLTKIGARYEFVDEGLKVWHDGSPLNPVDVTIAPTPGLVPDWKPLLILLLLKADGVSIVHDTVYVDRNEFTKDLNRMSAGLEVLKPSDVDLTPVISDDSYSIDTQGEPSTIIRVSGPCKLRGEKLHIDDTQYGAVLVLAALFAEGKSCISGIENVDYHFERFVEKLKNLGAKITAYESDD
ncbi:UDP-N-acetylglucosamine 1-carboxyvinyltransferase [Patescibacteria group bacterium]|nr:UDP-N-acetylglucosamine 1-carboxyvinyltransferase [Patescibacteria group bacterium]